MTTSETNEMATLASETPAPPQPATTSAEPAESTSIPPPASATAVATSSPPAEESITAAPAASASNPAAAAPTASTMTRKDSEAIGAAGDDAQPKADPEAGPTVLITLLLTTGKRHPYKIDARYLRKRNVTVEDNNPWNLPVQTLKELILRDWREGELHFTNEGTARVEMFGALTRESGEDKAKTQTQTTEIEMQDLILPAPDPSAALAVELQSHYAVDWEEKPNSPSAIRLISMGLELQEGELLRDKRFNPTGPNIVHMVIKRELPEDEEIKDGGKKGSNDASSRRNSGCCGCVIL